VCVRPVLLRRIDTVTGVIMIIDVPCGATLGTVGRSFGNSEPSTPRDLALPDVATLEQLVERVVEPGDHQSGATW
jgi:hypothetical protein